MIENDDNSYFTLAFSGSVFHSNHFAILADYIKCNKDAQVLTTNCVEKHHGTTFLESDKLARDESESMRDLVFFRTEDNTRLMSTSQFTMADMDDALRNRPHSFIFKRLEIKDGSQSQSTDLRSDETTVG